MFEYIGIVAPDRSLSSEIGRLVRQVEIIVSVSSHLIRNVNDRVVRVKLHIELRQVELLLRIHTFLNSVAILILRLLFIRVLLSLFLLCFIEFLQ